MTTPVGESPAEAVDGLLTLRAVAICGLRQRSEEPSKEVAKPSPLNVAATVDL